MRTSNLRVLDAMRRVRVDLPLFKGSDRIMTLLLVEGLASPLATPTGVRLRLSDHGSRIMAAMMAAEAQAALRGCWPFVASASVTPSSGAAAKASAVAPAARLSQARSRERPVRTRAAAPMCLAVGAAV